MLAFIGGGAMGEAMIGGLLNSHVVEPKAITASDPHKQRDEGSGGALRHLDHDREPRRRRATRTSSFCR